MKPRRILLGFILLATFPLTLQAGGVSKELKEKLFARYDKKDVILVQAAFVGLSKTKAFGYSFNVRVTHFHESVEIPKKIQKLERMGSRAYVRTFGDAEGVDRIPPGERLRADRFFVRNNNVEFELRSFSPPRISRAESLIPTSVPGVQFIFMFPKSVMESGDYDTVVRTINEYLVPEHEYREQVIAAREAAQEARETGKKVEIHPGMSQEEVIRALGEPEKTIVFGTKTILKYRDITVELEDNKVVDVKAN